MIDDLQRAMNAQRVFDALEAAAGFVLGWSDYPNTPIVSGHGKAFHLP